MTLALSLIAVAVQLGGEDWQSCIEWRDDWMTSGQVWRFATGHLAHWSWNHLAWDLVAVAGLGAVLETRGRGRFVVCVLGTWVLTEGALRWTGAFESYRGLSGVAMGLFGLAALRLGTSGRGWRRWAGWLAWGALLGKVLLEMGRGEGLFVAEAGFRFALEAHLAGIVAALLATGPTLAGYVKRLIISLPNFQRAEVAKIQMKIVETMMETRLKEVNLMSSS